MWKGVDLRWTLLAFGLLCTRQELKAAPDVAFWTVRETGTTAHLRSVTYAAGRFVVAGDGGTIMVSTRSGWERIESGWTNDLTGITSGNGTLVAVGTAGMLLSSPDGMTWTRRDGSVDEAIRCVTFGDGDFLALSSSNSLMSQDGIAWLRYSVPRMNPESVCYGNGRFVSVGGRSVLEPDGELRESEDGQTWRLWPQGSAVYHDVLFADGYFTAVGEGLGPHLILNNLLWRAPGVVEQGGPKTFSGGTRAIAFGDGVFVSVGGTRAVPNPWWIGQIASSPTGDNPWMDQDRPIEPWPQTYFQLDHLLLDVAYGAGKFVAVGEGGLLVESGAAARFDPRRTRVQASGELQLAVLSPVGSHVQVEATSDFQSWSTLVTSTNASGTALFQVAPKSNGRFFRATLLPKPEKF